VGSLPRPRFALPGTELRGWDGHGSDQAELLRWAGVALGASTAYLDSSVKTEGEGGGTLCSSRRRLLPPSAQSSNTAGAAELSRPAKPPEGSLDSSASCRSTLSFDGGSPEDGVGDDGLVVSAVKIQRTWMRSAMG